MARVAIVIVNNIYCIPTYLVWMGLLSPLKMIQPTMFYKIEGIFFHWLLAVVSMWSYSAGYDSEYMMVVHSLVGAFLLASDAREIYINITMEA